MAIASPIKWTGGKRRILSQILAVIPEKARLVEPFFGGGTVGLNHAVRSQKRVVWNDRNPALFNFWAVISRFEGDPGYRAEFNRILDSLTKEFPIPPERWYAIRDRFNHLKDRPTPSLERAALFAYLNKTCFNGLYRVNKEGNFNVPMGQYKRPPSFVGVREMSLPSSIQPPFVSTAMDFEAFVEKAREEFCGEEVFVYFDPPYHRTFSGYCDGDFRESDHRRLRHLCAKLSHDGLSWAVSNSDTPFIRKLYEGCKCLDISVSRTNGAKPSSRGKTNELLILPR